MVTVLEIILWRQVMLRRTALFRAATGDSSLKMVEKLRGLGRTDFKLFVGVTGLFDRLSISFNAEALAPIGCNRKYFTLW